MEYVKVTSKIKVTKTKGGRRKIRIKGVNGNKVKNWKEKDRKKIDKASKEFTGVECSHLILSRDERDFHKTHRFQGSDGTWYAIYAHDSENPRGAGYTIIESKKQRP